jgi:hypothetical protein
VLRSVEFAAYDLHERVAIVSARSKRPLSNLNLFLKASLPLPQFGGSRRPCSTEAAA